MNSRFPDKLPVGISQCLLGDNVRYDGSNKRSRVCTELLSQHFDFIPVCPEMGIGMGAPRAAIHLRENLPDHSHKHSHTHPQNHRIRVVGRDNADFDVTEKLQTYAREKAVELAHLCGYIFMDRSPSCGLANVNIHQKDGRPTKHYTAGIYAREFIYRHPLLPVEEEGRLQDSAIFENFVTRVYAWKRWNDFLENELTQAGLQKFHARHKYLLMAQRPESYRRLGHIVALAHLRPLNQVTKDYAQEFMAALEIISSPQRHANVLQHLLGYFKHKLDSAGKQETLRLIEEYRQGHLQRSAPLALLKQHLKNHPNDYLQHQVYLEL
jgi:uncharacterized protein YbgA (DUF1722 family)/uncharacterized protein YbbK (DUF523 family)